MAKVKFDRIGEGEFKDSLGSRFTLEDDPTATREQLDELGECINCGRPATQSHMSCIAGIVCSECYEIENEGESK